MGLVRDTISKNIFRYRNERGFSQKEFAEILGVPQSRVSNWEHNLNSPNIEMLFTICEVLKIPIDTLYSAEDDIEYRLAMCNQLLEEAGYSTDVDEKDNEFHRVQIIHPEHGTVCTLEINQLIALVSKIIREGDERKENYIRNRIRVEFSENNL